MKILDDRGDAMIEFAVVAPALMLLILGVLQFGLWFHAQHVVQTAALEASRVVAAEEGTTEKAESRAFDVLRAGLGASASLPVVEVGMTPDLVSVHVQTTMRGLLPIPGLTEIELESHAASYRERFRTADQ